MKQSNIFVSACCALALMGCNSQGGKSGGLFQIGREQNTTGLEVIRELAQDPPRSMEFWDKLSAFETCLRDSLTPENIADSSLIYYVQVLPEAYYRSQEKVSWELAQQYLEPAAKDSNNWAQIGMAIYSKAQGDEASLHQWMAQAGQTDSPELLLHLGWFYRYPQEILEKDEKKSFQFMKKSAEKGNYEAQFKIAELYWKGEAGVEQDKNEAIRWYRKAAEGENVEAMVNLAFIYADGKGVEQDLAQAEKWLRKATEIEPKAMFFLQAFLEEYKK